ncbi:MAG: glycosyltransferase family 4 protein [Clostridia bacterium]|nr:glycosyltransferase family 4 protein [Clostridia bacterium]
MKKVLFTATVDSHILHFHIPFLKLFKENGYEVHVATNGNEEIPYCDVKHTVSFERSPLKINNLKAIKQLKEIIDSEKFDIIHCHTPMGSVVTRLAALKARKNGTRVIYTAHGFHFFKGAPLKNWLIFYPVEKYLSKYTDTLITINQEDYELAKNKFTKCKDIQYVPGVGIDPKKFDFEFSDEDKKALRGSLGLKEEDFVMIYPAEISNRKRQMWLIDSVKELLQKNSDLHLLLPGKDSLNGKCQELTNQLRLDNQIHILGYRKDIPQLLKISNLAVSTANQEGLPVNLMEAMYVGLPIVASNCRGNRDLITNENNGFLVELEDSEEFTKDILLLRNDKELSSKFDANNQTLINSFLLDGVMKEMKKIYNLK